MKTKPDASALLGKGSVLHLSHEIDEVAAMQWRRATSSPAKGIVVMLTLRCHTLAAYSCKQKRSWQTQTYESEESIILLTGITPNFTLASSLLKIQCNCNKIIAHTCLRIARLHRQVISAEVVQDLVTALQDIYSERVLFNFHVAEIMSNKRAWDSKESSVVTLLRQLMWWTQLVSLYFWLTDWL